MNVLAIGAHPDDIEYGCGGMLTKYAEKGHTVYLFIASDGGLGGEPSVRRREQMDSAVIIGAMVIAPLMGPAMAASVGTVVGEPDLVSRGVRYQITGLLVAIVSAALFGFLVLFLGDRGELTKLAAALVQPVAELVDPRGRRGDRRGLARLHELGRDLLGELLGLW